MNSPNSVKVFLAFLTLSAINSSSFAAQTQMSSQIKAPSPTPFPVCIDDSDCVKLGKGDKFACFQYICYPWKNDEEIDPKNKRKTCREDNDCDSGQECFRHHDKRMVNRGLCFDEVKSCQEAKDCSKSYECCGGTCCEAKYYTEFAKLPCISHLGCQDLGLGDYCCPGKTNGTQSECCDQDPNPPPTTQPPALSQTASANSIQSASMTLAVFFGSLLVAFNFFKNL